MKASIPSHKSKKSHKSPFRQLHGGELKVETKEGDGTTFIVCLPTT